MASCRGFLHALNRLSPQNRITVSPEHFTPRARAYASSLTDQIPVVPYRMAQGRVCACKVDDFLLLMPLGIPPYNGGRKAVSASNPILDLHVLILGERKSPFLVSIQVCQSLMQAVFT